MMKTRSKTIGWVLSGIAAAALAASSIDKMIGSEHALQMASSFGISSATYRILGVIEIVSVVLFLFPRTGIAGILLLSSYFGGAIATHLQHQQNIIFPIAIEAILWIAAVLRFPELTARIVGRSTSDSDARICSQLRLMIAAELRLIP